MTDLNLIQYYIWILQLTGVANPRGYEILRHFGSAQNAYIALQSGNVGFFSPSERETAKTCTLEKSQEILATAASCGYSAISIDDEIYPTSLHNIPNPPILLFYKGDIDVLNKEACLTVIGTRDASDYSYRVTGGLIAPLAKCGMTIVSGMAVGLDKAAISTALKNGGKAVGVLACGCDIDYPRNSVYVRDEIASAGGVVITEQLPGGRAERWYFLLRNRLMSGLSPGTLIIEADTRSGCLITANHAIEQDRDVFCVVPHDIFDNRYGGVVPLLRDGAVPVFSYIDILHHYHRIFESFGVKPEWFFEDYEIGGYQAADTPEQKVERPHSGRRKSAEKRKAEKATPKANPTQPEPIPPTPPPNLNQQQQIIYDLLSSGKKNLDQLIQTCGFEQGDLYEVLLDMELDGIIQSCAGASYVLCN